MQTADSAPEHFDVLIVGAGISGIGAAYRFSRQSPSRSFVVLEAEDSFGGTWHTNTFPGIRSDSDLFTFGYDFKPWSGPPIATAAEIQRYIGEVIQENGLDRHIRYRHRIARASWDSDASLWTIHATDEAGRPALFTASFLFMCQGYFRHREGFAPTWPGMDKFNGQIVHAQSWPNDLDLTNKNVLVVGSGATAATIVPRVAETAKHVTMLQRSPTYFFCSANANELADRLRALHVDEAWIHEIVRRDILAQEANFTKRCFEEPEAVRAELIAGVASIVGDETAAKHFTPRYRPWQQRVAFLPNGDLLNAIKSGSASVETSEIERFTTSGVRLTSGVEIAADVVVLATGFNMNLFGDIAFEVDGQPLDWAGTVTYRGMMFTGVPNLAWVFGYFRSSWTLRSDLVAAFVMRLLDHMEKSGAHRVDVAVPKKLSGLPHLPWIAEENFNPGYLKRALPLLPRRLDHVAWQHSQDYHSDLASFPAIDLEGAEFRYDGAEATALDTEIALWLSAFPEQSDDDWAEMPAEPVRAGYLEQVQTSDERSASDVEVQDVVVPTRSGAVAARLYIPSSYRGSQLAPGLVYFHGGGFVIGDLETHDGHCRRLAHGGQVKVIAVDYRLAPEYPFPSAHNDAVDAFRWVCSNAEKLGLDPERIAVGGDSAGGNLAASVALDLKSDARCSPAFQLLIYPATWPQRRTLSRQDLNGPILTHGVMAWFERCLAADAHPECNRAHLAERNLSGVAPALIVTAGFDPLKDEGRMFAQALIAAGGECEQIHFASLPHDFCLLTAVSKSAAAASSTIAESLRDLFAAPALVD